MERLVPERQRDSHKSYKRKSGGGRKPQDPRKVFEGILYVLRTGCQWKAVPKSEYGSSSIHKYFLEWQAMGLFEQLSRGYIPYVRPRGEEIEEKDKNPDFKARRWVVEVCHSWFNRFRKLLIRYEKMDRSYLGLLMPAASVIVLRKIEPQNMSNIIYG